MTNIIRAVFSCNKYDTTATRINGKPIYQYNYGQILQIHGLDLPKAVEIHFSHSMGGSDAIIRIGTTTDKVTEVAVPEKFLESYGTVTTYIYVSDTESGQTEYKIQFQIAQRAKPEAWDSPEDGELFHQAIEAVNTSAGKAEDAAVRAEVSAGNAEQSAQDAEISATAAKTSETTAKNLADGFLKTVDDSKVDITTHTAQEKEQAISAIKAQGEEVQENISESVNTANTAKTDLETAINNAPIAKSQLEQVITDAGPIKSQLSQEITEATTINATLNGTIQSGNNLKQDLDASNASAKSNIEELRSENFNSKEILAGVTDLRAFLGLENTEVAGITVDFTNKTFTRLAGAEGLSGGADFDKFAMYGGRKRCNVNNAGVITAWFDDSSYKEDGSNGQVMVYQPKFYYMMYPLLVEQNTQGIGYHLRKANYYVSDYPLAGFKLHPAFYDAQGNEIDYILMGAYEGSIFDVSANAYILDDAQVMDYANDLFCSIAGAKPASGKTQNLTRPNLNQMCMNRGTGWYSDNIKATSANQMLMIIEMGMMNMQTAIGQGVVNVEDNPNTENNSKVTGGTSALGNGTGQATGTSGQVSVSYRGYENPWGNIWKFIYGVNIWGDGTLGGGVPYYATDFNFAESKIIDNYVSAGFSITNANGYVSAIGYAPECDWMFIASECLGNSSVPVGDYTYITVNLNGYMIARLGGSWNTGSSAGAFYWYLDNGVGSRHRVIGGRLVYVPTATA